MNMSLATYLPPGFKSAMYGVSLKMSQTSCRVKSMPASFAIAGKCNPAFVDPPEAATTRAAFSRLLRVTTSRARMFLSNNSMIASPDLWAKVSRISYGAGAPAEPGNARPIASLTQAIVLAVNCAPQEPALGHAMHSKVCKSSSLMLPTAC